MYDRTVIPPNPTFLPNATMFLIGTRVSSKASLKKQREKKRIIEIERMKYNTTFWLLALPSLAIQSEVTTSQCEMNILKEILQTDYTSEPWTCSTEDDRYSSFLQQESGNMDIQINENLLLACNEFFHSEAMGNSTLFCITIHEEIDQQYYSLLLPSEEPSQLPSSLPSKEPSEVPSEVPSVFPSVSPSSEPSRMPSEMPASAPSGSPSELPSMVPSAFPSETLSQIPSSLHSDESSNISSSHFSNKNVSSIVPNDDQYLINSINTPSESPSSSSTAYLILSASLASVILCMCCRCRRKKVKNRSNLVSIEALNEFDNDLSNNV